MLHDTDPFDAPRNHQVEDEKQANSTPPFDEEYTRSFILYGSINRQRKLYNVASPNIRVDQNISIPAMTCFTEMASSSNLPEPSKLKNSDCGKILVVDDEKFNCDIVYGFLMILGFKERKERTTFAYNGEQAVKEIKKAIDEKDPMRFSLILMDCNMPFLDGYAATKKIRKMYANLGILRENQPKIIAITGHVEVEYQTKAIASGMDKVYQKPL